MEKFMFKDWRKNNPQAKLNVARRPFKAQKEITLIFNKETKKLEFSSTPKPGDRVSYEDGKPADGKFTLPDGRFVICSNGTVGEIVTLKELVDRGI